MHGGYGIYYDRVTLEILSLEQGLDGRALPINVYGGNVNYLDPTGHFVPGAPTISNPFSGFIIPGAGGAQEGMNVIDNNIQNPMVQQFNLGVQYEFAKNWIVRADGIHNLGTHFLIGVPVGSVFNPDSGGPESVTRLQSSANTHYDALWLTLDKTFSSRYQFHAAYTLVEEPQLHQLRSGAFRLSAGRSHRSPPRIWTIARRSAQSLRACKRP